MQFSVIQWAIREDLPSFCPLALFSLENRPLDEPFLPINLNQSPHLWEEWLVQGSQILQAY